MKKQATSYKVFMKHVSSPEEGSEVNVLAIFSRECFIEWLSTRPSEKLKFPAQSYQRVLYAHLRGSDKRRPFPEPVEVALLKVLRDNDHNPWSEVFKDEIVFFGKRGFRSKGFHEREKLKSMQLIVPNDLQNTKIVRNEGTSLKPSNRPRKLCATLISRVEPNPFEINGFFPRTLWLAPRNSTVPWEAMKNSIQQYIPLEEQLASKQALAERKLNIWSPAIFYYLNNLVDSSDYRFSATFLFPHADDRVFRADLPVARMFVNASSVIFHEDAECVRMFGGSLVGKHHFEIFDSFVSLCYSFIESLPRLFGDGVVWRRDVLKRNDKSKMVCLFTTVKVGDIRSCCLQDVSSFYPNVISRVCFL